MREQPQATTADQWVERLDRELAEKYDGIVSDQTSYAYANGHAAGVSLSYDDPDIDDERGQLVSEDGRWVVRYDITRDWWSVREVRELNLDLPPAP